MSRVSRAAALAALLILPAGCSGIDLLSTPPREVKTDTGPLTVPPHMQDGAHQ